MRHRLLARIMLVTTLALLVPTAVLMVLNRNAAELWSIYEPQSLLAIIGSTSVGYVLATRRPDSWIGWLLLAMGLTGQIAGLISLWAIYGLVTNPGMPGAAFALWVSLWLSALGLAATPTLLILLFPDGRLTTRTARLLAAFAGFGTLVVVSGLMTGNTAPPGFPELFERTPNPLALERATVDPGLGIILIGLCSLLAIGLLVARFRHSHGVERQQYKWVVLAMAFVVISFVLDFVARGSGSSAYYVTGPALSFSIALVPVAMAVAILRHRLFDIDRIINRALVSIILTGGLVGAYVLAVIVFQSLLDPVTQGGDLAVATTTLVVAALFQPLRTRIQRTVDRRFNRTHYNASQTIEAFTDGLRNQVDLKAVGNDLQAVVDATMQPVHVSLWIRTD